MQVVALTTCIYALFSRKQIFRVVKPLPSDFIMATKPSQPPSKRQKGPGKQGGGGESGKAKSKLGAVTVEQLESDNVSQLAAQYWKGKETKPFSPQVSESGVDLTEGVSQPIRCNVDTDSTL